MIDDLRRRIDELAQRETLLVFWWHSWGHSRWEVLKVGVGFQVDRTTWPRPCEEHDEPVFLGLVTLEPQGDSWVARGETPLGDHFSVECASRDECIAALSRQTAHY